MPKEAALVNGKTQQIATGIVAGWSALVSFESDTSVAVGFIVSEIPMFRLRVNTVGTPLFFISSVPSSTQSVHPMSDLLMLRQILSLKNLICYLNDETKYMYVK